MKLDAILQRIKSEQLRWIAGYLANQGYTRKKTYRIQKTKTAWENALFSNNVTGTIDLYTDFDVPLYTKEVLLRVVARDTGGGGYGFHLSTTPDYPYLVSAVNPTSAISGYWTGWMPTTGGKTPFVYYLTSASGTNTLSVYVRVWGHTY